MHAMNYALKRAAEPSVCEAYSRLPDGPQRPEHHRIASCVPVAPAIPPIPTSPRAGGRLR